ncbi:MAG TPA: hypothetical protein PLN52_26055 [Opitutaceae bacterium]|nr:hypothetical protein [Opitutaceae bacterium]
MSHSLAGSMLANAFEWKSASRTSGDQWPTGQLSLNRSLITAQRYNSVTRFLVEQCY